MPIPYKLSGSGYFAGRPVRVDNSNTHRATSAHLYVTCRGVSHADTVYDAPVFTHSENGGVFVNSGRLDRWGSPIFYQSQWCPACLKQQAREDAQLSLAS